MHEAGFVPVASGNDLKMAAEEGKYGNTAGVSNR